MPGKKKLSNRTRNRNLIKETLTVFTNRINHLLKQSNINIEKSYTIKVKLGVKRCFGRIWRKEDDRDPDINCRCTNAALEGSDLCGKCTILESNKKKSWCGRVTERPSPHLISVYAKRLGNDKNIDYHRIIIDNIRLHDHDEFKSDKKTIGEYRIEKFKKTKKLKIKRKMKIHKVKILTKYNSNSMEMEQKNEVVDTSQHESVREDCEMFYNIDYSLLIKELKKTALEEIIHNSKLILNDSQFKKDKIKEILDKLGDNSVTGNFLKKVECLFNDIINDIDILAILNSNIELEKKSKKSTTKVNIYDLESIRLIDCDHNAYDLYYRILKDGYSNLYNQNSKKIGFIRNYVDDEGEIPSEFKTADNIVLDPLNKLPVLEVEISVKGSGFEAIKPGIYREFEYDEDIEVFRTTGTIIRS